jgi:hypothetical protein
MPYHIVRSRSKTKPFNVVLLSTNGELVSNHPLKTKQACFKNIVAQMGELHGYKIWCHVQDDTYEEPVLFRVWRDGHKSYANIKKFPKYAPGPNKKKKHSSKK